LPLGVQVGVFLVMKVTSLFESLLLAPKMPPLPDALFFKIPKVSSSFFVDVTYKAIRFASFI
jgi:hypothetical protein